LKEWERRLTEQAQQDERKRLDDEQAFNMLKAQAQLEAQQAFDMLKGSMAMQEQNAAAAAAAAAVHVSVYTTNQELTAQTLSLKEQVASLNEQLRSLGIYAEREHSAACAKASHVIALERANRDLEERTRVALERQGTQ